MSLFALRARGYSLFEALIAVAVLGVLLFVIGDALAHTLRAASLSGGRASIARTTTELATRLSEEARSSTAVFIPTTDVLGNSNTGSSTHEVDFFRRLSAGGDAYVAYTLDAASGVVTRYEYSLAAGTVAILHSDQAATAIAAFVPTRMTASATGDVVDAATVNDVSILYGTPGVVGGNDVVTVNIQASTSGGLTPAPIVVHLASRAAPTAVSVLVPAAPPPPPCCGVHTLPFIIRESVQIPRPGPWHGGSPGDPGDPTSSGIHQTVPGLIQFEYAGFGMSWLDLYASFSSLESGTYTYITSDGRQVIVSVSCSNRPCPKFIPLPTSGSPPAPVGGVAFDAAPNS